MELVIESAGEKSKVRVTRRGESYGVEVGGCQYTVHRIDLGGTHRSLVIDGQQIECWVERRGSGRYTVGDRFGESSVEVLDPLDALTRGSDSGSRSSAGGGQTSAYMPGRVVVILVSEGDTVEAGQAVLVLEAMKMENEIQAESSGVVRKIFVEADQSVESGAPLFEIGVD